jgi:hypothetical protein
VVANAVIHGGQLGAIRLVAAVEGDRVRVEVVNPAGASRPAITDRETGGLGLKLLHRFAVRCGVSHGRETRVWFEIIRRHGGHQKRQHRRSTRAIGSESRTATARDGFFRR